jgi:hypothetical protein
VLISSQNILPLAFLNQHANEQTLAKKLTELLDSYALRRKIIIHVKDEGSNLNTMTIALKSIIGCDMLGLEKKIQSICFGHAFSKAC